MSTQPTLDAQKLDNTEYLELCALVDKVLPPHKSFAPPAYYLKVVVILVASFALEGYMHYHASYPWYLTAALGFFYAMIGMNIQHDANHGSISRNPWVNRVLGWSQNWIGGSALDWVHQHVVQHHLFTNEVHHDPDIAGSDILRLNPLKPLHWPQALQHAYFFVLILFFGHIMVLASFWHLVEGVQFTRFPKTFEPLRMAEGGASLLFFARWFVLPLVLRPAWSTALGVLPLFAVGGYYLAFFFIISHNFDGVHMYDRTAVATGEASGGHAYGSFLRRQVATSCNVGGAWLAVLNGGLNYQIEHHLFPRVQHSHYATIAPVVREFCRAKGIPYKHFPTVGT